MDASGKADSSELSTAEWFQFFEKLKQIQVFNISLNGGEIFLRDDLFILLKKLRENRMHKLSLFTNGTMINEENAGELARLSIKTISISVDGLEINHDHVRGKGTFQKTMQGIRQLIKAGITPIVAFTPLKSNYQDLGSLIDMLISEGITNFRVNSLSPEGRCLNIYEEVALEFPHQVKEVLTVVEEKKRLNPGFKITCELGFHYYLPQSYAYAQKNPQNFQMKHLNDGCSAANNSCTITPTGDVIPCEGLPMFVGGNIRESDFMDIWTHSENLKKIRDLAKVPMDQVPYCQKCKYIYLCNGGCRASSFLVYGDLLAPDFLCPLWKKDKTCPHPDEANIQPGEII